MEGKKCRALGKDCRAVSEVYGQLLMMSIVVLAFSGIALTVFSDGGVVKPEHIPNTDLREKINTHNNTVEIVHSGGEDIDLEEIKVVLYVKKPNQPETNQTFEMSDSSTVKVLDPRGNPKDISTDGFFTLGDCIVIYTNRDAVKENRIDLKSEDIIDMFFVHTPSKQVVQRVTLQCGNEENEENTGTKGRYWITPYPDGTATDTSGERMSTEAVNKSGDAIFTVYYPPDKNYDDPNSTAQIFDFNINATKEGVSTINKVKLKLVYSVQDNDFENIALDISVKEPENWIRVRENMPGYKKYFGVVDDIDLTSYVKTIDELQKFKVRVVMITKTDEAAHEKAFIDFLGIHVE